jgi:hypothetical protein
VHFVPANPEPTQAEACATEKRPACSLTSAVKSARSDYEVLVRKARYHIESTADKNPHQQSERNIGAKLMGDDHL